jgi:hypothetical protein
MQDYVRFIRIKLSAKHGLLICGAGMLRGRIQKETYRIGPR